MNRKIILFQITQLRLIIFIQKNIVDNGALQKLIIQFILYIRY